MYIRTQYGERAGVGQESCPQILQTEESCELSRRRNHWTAKDLRMWCVAQVLSGARRQMDRCGPHWRCSRQGAEAQRRGGEGTTEDNECMGRGAREWRLVVGWNVKARKEESAKACVGVGSGAFGIGS